MITKRKKGLNVFKFWLSLFFLYLFFFAISTVSEAAYLKNIPVKIIQPNGEEIQFFASGDEFYNWLHDKDGFTIIQNSKTGYYVYAIEREGDLLPSNYAITSDYVVNTASISYLNIPPYLKHSWEKRKKPKELFPEGSPANVDKIRKAPQTGVINNIVIFIRFSDESEFTDSISTYDAMFNDTTAGANSMYNYFKEVSYDQLSVTTTFYPTSTTTVVSYQDSQPRAYYQEYDETTNTIGYQDDDERTEREHTLLKNAVDYVNPLIPGSLDVDADGDNFVDNVCFIIYGDPDGWSNLLWPHFWSLYTKEAYINGKLVYTYNIQLQTSLYSSGVGVLCHEMFHSMGAPDLYHYSYDGLQPVYEWDIMECDLNPPQHMGAYMKHRYGTWISSIPEITSDGTYDLNPLTSPTNNCYKIASPYSSTECFMVEYRAKIGTFENSLPGEGLLVYRINTSKDGEGNREGPPDEVYIYRPDGTTAVNGDPSNANFSIDVDRTAINDTSNPSSFLSSGCQGGLDISNVGSVNGVISFDITIIAGLELAEALDNDDLAWESAGDGDGWLGQTCVYFYDNDAAQSSDISDDQSNYLETTVQGPVNLAFYWKVSSEEDYDFLTFYVDDEQIYQISGDVDWEQKIYPVSEGSHSIKWEYKKDALVSGGSDCGWVDKVEYISDIPFAISGTVKTAGGEGIEGVTIAFSNEGGSTATDSSGNYSHGVSFGWSGTATPSKAGYIFSPTSREYTNVTSDQTDQDYTATPTGITYTISGKVSIVGSSSLVRVSNQAGLSGVLMYGLPGSPITDASGDYSAIVDYDWSGTVMPTKAGYFFSPSSRNYSNVTSNQGSQDYTAHVMTTGISWTTGGPYGGYIKSLAMSHANPDIIYARTRDGAYKTVDAGATWTKTGFPEQEFSAYHDPGNPDIVVSPDNHDVVYTGTRRLGIYKSEDGGDTWMQKGLSGLKVNAIAIDSNNSSIIYVGTGDWFMSWEGDITAIYKSTDGGENWELKHTLSEFDQVNVILIDSDNSSHIYAGLIFGDSGFLKSIDGGNTWHGENLTSSSSEELYSLAMTPAGYSSPTIYAVAGSAQGGDLYKSTDRGENWTKVECVWATMYDGKCLAVDPISPEWVYVGTKDTEKPLFAYYEDFDEWYYVGVDLPPQSPSSIAVSPQERYIYYLGFFEAGVYKYIEGGTWNLTNMMGTKINDLAIHPHSSDTAFAAIEGSGHSLTKTTNRGASWSNLTNSPFGIGAVAIDPQNPSIIYVGEGYDYYAYQQFGIYKSADEGQNWDFIAILSLSGWFYVGVSDIWIHSNDSNLMMVTMEGLSEAGGAYRSTNGGETWGKAIGGSHIALASDPVNPNVVYNGKEKSAQIYRSDDGGSSWTEITPADGFGDIQDIEVDTDSEVYVATNSGLWKRSGSSWAELSGLPTEDITALAIDKSPSPNIIYAGTSGYGVYASQDGGSTWTPFNDGLENLDITKLAVSDTNTKVLYAGTSYGGVWSISTVPTHTISGQISLSEDSIEMKIAGGEIKLVENRQTKKSRVASSMAEANVEVELSGVLMSGLPGNTITDATGNYSAAVEEGWSGTVTPTKAGYVFSPSSRTYTNVTSNQTGENYAATVFKPAISGSVKTSAGTGVGGVTITFSDGGGTATTNLNGNYSHEVSYGWSGTATPSKAGYTFSPTSRDYISVTSDQAGEDYTGTVFTYTVAILQQMPQATIVLQWIMDFWGL
jgi:M6 family metalloprotease-like protein